MPIPGVHCELRSPLEVGSPGHCERIVRRRWEVVITGPGSIFKVPILGLEYVLLYSTPVKSSQVIPSHQNEVIK
jgi:hypothetical protein